MTELDIISVLAAIIWAGGGNAEGIHPGGFEGAVTGAIELRAEAVKQMRRRSTRTRRIGP